MTQDLTPSQQVLNFLDNFEGEDDVDISPQERAELNEGHRVIKVIVNDVIASRETLTDGKLAAIEKLVNEMPEAISHFLNGRYTRQVVEAVPGYVRRTMELSRLEGSSVPSKMTNRYVQEAARTYIFGLPQASVALCRAAIEQALKEKLKIQGASTFVTMNNLLKRAVESGVIDEVIRQTVRTIANEADAVLHEKPADLAKAYEVLVMLRGALQHLYG